MRPIKNLKSLIVFAFLFVVLGVTNLVTAQTLYVPSGVNGIGTSSVAGNVGIGTSTPAWPMHIVRTSNDASIGLVRSGTSPAQWYIHSGRLGLGEFSIGDASQYRFVIRSNGNVGIGTTTPATSLDITGGTSSLSIAYSAGARTAGYYATLYSSYSNNTGYLAFAGASGNGKVIGGNNYGAETSIYAKDTERIRILSNGNVGIGTTAPTEKLDVNGNVSINGNIMLKNANRSIGTTNNYSLTLQTNSTPRVTIDHNGKVDINGNVFLPLNKNLVFGTSINEGVSRLRIIHSAEVGHSYIDFKDNLHFRADVNWVSPLILQGDGNVAVGYQTTYSNDGTQYQTKGHKLAVNGSALVENGILHATSGINSTTITCSQLNATAIIYSKEIRVLENVPKSDHVFKSDYKLRTLGEVKQFIDENGHLPEVPSAQEFKENGYLVGDMDDILLRKVEELTLYILDLNKRMEALEQENAQLRSKAE